MTSLGAIVNRPLQQRILVPPARVALPAPARLDFSGLLMIWRGRWMLLGCIVLAMAAATVYVAKATRIYRSSSQIYVQQGGPKLLADLLTSGPAPQNYLFTQCDLIKSSAIVSPALEAPEVRQSRALKDVDNPVTYLKDALQVSVGKQSDIITVSVETPYPQDSALLANAVVDSYINYQTKRQQTTAGEIVKILQKEKDKYEQELRETNKKMIAFKQANPALSFESDKGNIITQRLEQLSNELTRAQIATLQVKLVNDAAKSMGDNPATLKQLVVPGGIAGGISAADNQELWTEQRRLRQGIELARAVYGPDHRNVKAYEQQLENLQKDMTNLDRSSAANYRAVLRAEYIKAQANEAELSNALEQQRKMALELNTKATEYQQLELDARRAKETLDILYARIKELNVTQDTPQHTDILEFARPSGKPVKPGIALSYGIAFALAVLLGGGGVVLREFMDPRMRSVEEVCAVLNLPALGIVPHTLGTCLPEERGRQVHLNPRSTVAEAYRTVRTAIYFGSAEPQHKTLLVTSPAPGDGKSTLASNLAIAMAQAGRRVLLIDMDMRRPMLHHIFQVPNKMGISTVLLRQSTLEQSIQQTCVENLDLLPCGPAPSNPSEILSGKAFFITMSALCSEYDQIVIDSPPVEPVTDARILAAACDATILVLRAEKSTRRLSTHARDALVGVGANLLGLVINAAPRGNDGYGYGSGYYHYGYGQRSNGGSNGNGHKEIHAIPAGHGNQ